MLLKAISTIAVCEFFIYDDIILTAVVICKKSVQYVQHAKDIK